MRSKLFDKFEIAKSSKLFYDRSKILDNTYYFNKIVYGQNCLKSQS